MASTDIISYSMLDASGKRKALEYFIPSGGTIAGAQGLVDVTALLIDAAVDAVIDRITIQLTLDKPAGLKSVPVNGNRVREGALIAFSVTGADYRWSTYFPSWKNAGFVLDTVNNVTPYSDVITDLGQYVDKYDNPLDTYIEGYRTFRK
jgi:hypothetical protein